MLDGRIRWAFPFLARDVAEAHFTTWTDTLRRLRDGANATVLDTTTAKESARRIIRFAGIEMTLFPRPIELQVPINGEAFRSLHSSFWRRELWLGQDPGKETGWEGPQRHSDVQHNLWKLFDDLCEAFGGQSAGRVAIALDNRNAVEPDQYYFQAQREECMIEGDYFQGVPRMIAEVLSPASRSLDRGPRMDGYRHAGVQYLWLLDPETETVEEYALERCAYSMTGRHRPGESFRRLCSRSERLPSTRFSTRRRSGTQTGGRRPSTNPCRNGSCRPKCGWGWRCSSSLAIPKGATRFGTTARHAC
jgi:hypothetical protein